MCCWDSALRLVGCVVGCLDGQHPFDLARLQAAEANASAPSLWGWWGVWGPAGENVNSQIGGLEVHGFPSMSDRARGVVAQKRESETQAGCIPLRFLSGPCPPPTPSISIRLRDLLLSLTQPRQPHDDNSHTAEAYCQDTPLCPSLAVCCWLASGRLRFLGWDKADMARWRQIVVCLRDPCTAACSVCCPDDVNRLEGERATGLFLSPFGLWLSSFPARPNSPWKANKLRP